MGGDGRADEASWMEALDEALSALRDVLIWELHEPDWEQVSKAVSDIANAAAAGDLRWLWRATGYLDLCSPLRVATRLGDTPRLPAPKAVREQTAELIGTLSIGAATRDGADMPGDSGTGRRSQLPDGRK
jgi:CATRA-associated small protein